MLERLDKFLAHNGFGSRKEIRRLVGQRLVAVNGERATDTSMKIEAASDRVTVGGQAVEPEAFVYLMLNKPAGYVSAKKEGFRQTVFDLLDENYRTPFFADRLHCIGRLDVDTEGLLLLTTDGKLTHKITSPKSNSAKKYFVRLRDAVDCQGQALYAKKFLAGIRIEAEGKEPAADCRSAALEWLSGSEGGRNECLLSITEGKFHQVKRMFAAVGNEVVYLRRVAIGGLRLDESLGTGQYRKLSAEEVALLRG